MEMRFSASIGLRDAEVAPFGSSFVATPVYIFWLSACAMELYKPGTFLLPSCGGARRYLRGRAAAAASFAGLASGPSSLVGVVGV